MGQIKTLPGYEFLGQIAEGGMAMVWLARQISLNRQVAIKTLAPDFACDKEARARFHHEAQAAARLNHPGIVQVYDVGEHEESIFMVMEYVHGCTVADLLSRKTRLSERHSLLIAEGIALSLDYAWSEAQLTHCDIKPDNVLVAQDGSVKLTDLGLARFIGMHADADTVEGTPHYASPEQVRGEPNLDCRTDIYSLGAMLYHLTTGRLPFADSEGVQAMKRQIDDYLPDPTDINRSLSVNVAWLIEKMMVKDRMQRYASWPDVLGDIERVKAGERPHATPPTAGQSTVMRSEARTWSIVQPSPVVEVKEHTANQVGWKPATSKPKKEGSPEKAKQKKIVLPKDLRRQIANRSQTPAGRDLYREVVSLVLMLFAVIAAYTSLFCFHLFDEDAQGQTGAEYWDHSALTGVRVQKTAPTPRKTSSAPQKETVRPTSRPQAAAAAPQKDTAENWRHPTYLKGAHLFNDALEKYTRFQKDKENPAVLKIVEQQCREAIRAFEFVKPFAPKDLDIQRLIDQCYHLISDTRHSTLLLPASSTRDSASSAIQTPAAASMAQLGQEVDNLVLAPSWNAPQTGVSGRMLEDLAAMLNGVATPHVDLSADTSIVVFGHIFYLMPVQEAARIIGKPSGVRRRITTPGFPKDSFHYYTLTGSFDNGFDQIYLITDSSDRIVAVQLFRERNDKEIWIDASYFQDRWSTYNFVESKSKASSKWKVALRAEKAGRVLRVDSELVSHDPNAYFGLGDSKARASLFLPEPIANIMLSRVGTLQK